MTSVVVILVVANAICTISALVHSRHAKSAAGALASAQASAERLEASRAQHADLLVKRVQAVEARLRDLEAWLQPAGVDEDAGQKRLES